jgi:hypothetical protein
LRPEHSRRAAAARFRVSASFVINLMTAFVSAAGLRPRRSAAGDTASSTRTASSSCAAWRKRMTSACRSWLAHSKPPVILDNLSAQKAALPNKQSASEALGSCFCHPTAPTSIRSKWPSPNSRRTCAPWRYAHHRRTLERHRPNLRSLHPRRMRKLLRSRRIWIHRTVRCSRGLFANPPLQLTLGPPQPHQKKPARLAARAYF